MGDLEEVLDAVSEDEAGMNVSREVAEEGAASLSEEGIEEAAVTSWSNKVLTSAKTFKDWVIKGLASPAVANLIMLGTGLVMLYELMSAHANQAQATGKRIALSSAIDGVKKTLVDKHDSTILAPAKRIKNTSSKWNSLSADT